MMDRDRRRVLHGAAGAALCGVAPLGIVRAAAGELPALDASAAADRLARQPMVLMMRHERTDPGVGDPAGFRLDQCTTQRNLSAEGRARAREAGDRLRAAGLILSEVRSSRWCRCLDTARLAFGRVEPWPAIDSFFADPQRQSAQMRSLRDGLESFEGPRPWMLVKHQVVISASLGVWTAMGDIVAAERSPAGWRPVFRIPAQA
jgi:broad specificity phosphatase PhoE